MSSRVNALAAAGLATNLLVILAATTWPWSDFVGHAHWANVEWIPFSRRVRLLDFALNVLLFLPFGACASHLLRRLPPTARVALVTVLGCALSVTVEAYQVFCHGRLPTAADVLSNSLGAWLGARLALPPVSGQAQKGLAQGRTISAD